MLQVPVYDGSDTGEKLYDTLTVIGKAIAPERESPTDAAAGQAAIRRADALAGDDQLFRSRDGGAGASRRRSMRSLSSSTRTASRARCCSTTAISSSAGEMTSLEMRDVKPCP